jgi:Flp pilus assembly protein TadB
MNATPMLIASVAAFIGAVLLVLAVGRAGAQLLERYAGAWAGVQRRQTGKVSAVLEFLKIVLVAEGRKLDSVERLYGQLEKHVARASAPTTAEDYLARSLLEGVGCAVIGGILFLGLFGGVSFAIPVILGIAWALWVRPSLVASDGEKRSRMIYRAIPYALDLGVLVLQAGGTLREVLEQVAKGKGPFADELRITLNEIDSGASQATALKNMSNRVRLEPLDTVVLAINRGEETGAPMAETLATQAELFRERRLQELEKLAVEAPTKMAFPNMLIMLSVLILVIGPLIVRIVTSGMF